MHSAYTINNSSSTTNSGNMHQNRTTGVEGARYDSLLMGSGAAQNQQQSQQSSQHHPLAFGTNTVGSQFQSQGGIHNLSIPHGMVAMPQQLQVHSPYITQSGNNSHQNPLSHHGHHNNSNTHMNHHQQHHNNHHHSHHGGYRGGNMHRNAQQSFLMSQQHASHNMPHMQIPGGMNQGNYGGHHQHHASHVHHHGGASPNSLPVVVVPTSSSTSFYPDHPRYSGGFVFKVFNDERTHFIQLPSQYVLVTEGSTRYLNCGNAEQMAPRFVLCRHILRDRLCPRGSTCNFVHGVHRAAEGDPAYRRVEVHKNDAMETGITRYETLPPGTNMAISYPGEDRSITIPSQNVYKTRGSELYYRVLPNGLPPKIPQRCTHYHFKKMCHRGAECNFIHIAYDTGMLSGGNGSYGSNNTATNGISGNANNTNTNNNGSAANLQQPAGQNGQGFTQFSQSSSAATLQNPLLQNAAQSTIAFPLSQ